MCVVRDAEVLVLGESDDVEIGEASFNGRAVIAAESAKLP